MQINCEEQGFQVSWTGTSQDIPYWDVVVGWYAPDYWYESPAAYPSPAPPNSSNGNETVHNVPGKQEGWPLQGVYVWFEWGYWAWNGYNYYWVRDGGMDWYSYYIVRNCTCFAAGTPVLTPEGSKPIERFRAGDWILSSPEDDPTAPAVARRVKEVIRSRGELVDIAVSGRVVHASREHPFYVKAKGWTPAASLARGDLLRSHDDRWLPVESIVDADKSPVYNLRVEEHATYFVGRRDWGFSLWVYGACNRPKTPREQVAQSKSVRSRFPNEVPNSGR